MNMRRDIYCRCHNIPARLFGREADGKHRTKTRLSAVGARPDMICLICSVRWDMKALAGRLLGWTHELSVAVSCLRIACDEAIWSGLHTAPVTPFPESSTCCGRSSRPSRHERFRTPPEVELSPGDCCCLPWTAGGVDGIFRCRMNGDHKLHHQLPKRTSFLRLLLLWECVSWKPAAEHCLTMKLASSNHFRGRDADPSSRGS